MGQCTATIREMRFVIEDELTKAYILMTADGDCPVGVQGWHQKVFPASKSAVDILSLIRDGDDPVLWLMGAP